MQFSTVKPLLLAVERMDTWVLAASIAIPLLCLVGLALWHLIGLLARIRPKKTRTYRQSPEPLSAVRSPLNESERLLQACAALEDALAEKYLELGESWLRSGQREKAAAAFSKVLQVCPQGRQASLAQERLRQIGEAGERGALAP
jgi:tetratricopeptide (TPR) repeat protein